MSSSQPYADVARVYRKSCTFKSPDGSSRNVGTQFIGKWKEAYFLLCWSGVIKMDRSPKTLFCSSIPSLIKMLAKFLPFNPFYFSENKKSDSTFFWRIHVNSKKKKKKKKISEKKKFWKKRNILGFKRGSLCYINLT